MTTNIQLLRSSVANKRPNAATLLDGQAAININTAAAGLFFKLSDGTTLTKIGPPEVNSTGVAPNANPAGSAGNALGEMWFDGRASYASDILKVYDGTSFLPASGFTVDDATGNFSLDRLLTIRNGVCTGTGANSFFQVPADTTVAQGQIATPVEGMIRYNTTTDNYMGYYVDAAAPNGEWRDLGGGGAQVTVSDTAPVAPAPSQGDLWWNSDEGLMYVFYQEDAALGGQAQWVDTNPAAAGPNQIVILNDISAGFDGTTTQFQLSTGNPAVNIPNVTNPAQLVIQLGGVVQRPNVDYTINGSIITFTTAPQNADLTFAGRVLGSSIAQAAGGGNLGACAVTTQNGIFCWNSALVPTVADNTVDIGSAAVRPRNLFLSGTASIGGAAANPNISLNQDGSAEFAGGAADIDANGNVLTAAAVATSYTATTGPSTRVRITNNDQGNTADKSIGLDMRVAGADQSVTIGTIGVVSTGNNRQGRIVFGLPPDGQSFYQERMSINSDGLLTTTVDSGVLYTDTSSESSFTITNTSGAAANSQAGMRFRVIGTNTTTQASFGAVILGNNRNSKFYWGLPPDGSSFYRECMELNRAGNLTIIGAYSPASDETLKENITPAESQWSDIKAIELKNFDWKDRVDGVRQLGFIAQQVETVSPRLITEEHDDDGNPIVGTKKYKLEALVMKMLGALQESQTRIETLEAKVAALEAA